MKKSVLVIGIGRFGRAVIEGLFERGHDIFAVNKDEEALNDVRHMVVSGVILDVAEDDEELARIVGEKNFDEAVIAMGEDFEGTVIATHVLKDAGIFVSVKASSERRGNALLKMGADRVVYPERDMGQRLAQLISNDSSIDMLELPLGFVIEQMEVGPGFAGQTVEKINSTNRFGVWIMLVYQNNVPVQPVKSTRLNKGDIMVVFGQKTKMKRFEQENFG